MGQITGKSKWRQHLFELRRRRNVYKYKIAWYVGAGLSFILYFSGIVPLYVYMSRRYKKKHVAVVLMYHRIEDNGDDPDQTVTAGTFERQIAYLIKNYNVVSLDEIVDIYLHNGKLEKDTAAITFDDGFKNNYTDAYPILRKYNIPAAIFVTASLINQDNGLSEEAILIMQENNITFGAHTVTHKVLSKIDKAAAFSEINSSKSILEGILKRDVKYFAYPYGKRGRDFTDESMRIVEELGFRAAFATDNGFITSKRDLFALNRIGVRNFPMFVFKARISGIFENRLQHLLRKIVRI